MGIEPRKSIKPQKYVQNSNEKENYNMNVRPSMDSGRPKQPKQGTQNRYSTGKLSRHQSLTHDLRTGIIKLA